MIRNLEKYICVLGLFLTSSGCGSSDSGNTAFQPSPVVRVWERFESTLDLPVEAANPFDPAQVSVEATFVAPSGSPFTVPAFVTRNYERALVGGFEQLTAQGGLEWKVRFTPVQQGMWQWRWEMKTPHESRTSDWSTFEAAEPSHDAHGFVRVSTEDSRYLIFDDGAPYVAVGENLGWYDGRGTFAYDDWLSKLASQGVNYVRIWMPSWAFGLEWIERDQEGNLASSSLGNYTARLGRAWQLDQVLHRAEELGIYVMLCIQYHGPFSTTHNSEWVDNPYNAANGGPLATPREFYTDSDAQELVKRRLRYIVARWGYSANILAWELWNEVDLTEQPALSQLVDWHAEMADTLHGLEPYGHLITTSLSSTPAIIEILRGTSPYAPLWQLPELDFVQLHFYSIGEIPVDFSALFPAMIKMLRSYGKPVLVGEAGVDFRGPAETLKADPESVGFHDMLWSGLLSETFGTGMTWWWDNVIDPQDLYFHFRPASLFVDDVTFDRQRFISSQGKASAPGKHLRAYVLSGETVALVWVKNAAHQWYHPDTSAVDDAVLMLTELADGEWSGKWLDTYTGDILSEIHELEVNGPVEMAVPPFSRDVALRLNRIPLPQENERSNQ